MAKTYKDQKQPEKGMTPLEIETMMIQLQKDAMIPSLLYVTRKLGEVEGMISMQAYPGDDLINVQKDLNRVYDKLVEEAGIEQFPESKEAGIGGDRA
jgi:hypothetical protein